jgi:hypothetical protein
MFISPKFESKNLSPFAIVWDFLIVFLNQIVNYALVVRLGHTIS